MRMSKGVNYKSPTHHHDRGRNLPEVYLHFSIADNSHA